MKKFVTRTTLLIAATVLMCGAVLVGLVAILTVAGGGSVLISESLQQTGALGSGYALGWWLHLIGLAAVLLLCVIRWARKKQGVKLVPVAPLWIYGVLHLGLSWLLTTLDLSDSLQIAPALIAFVLLTVEMYLLVIFPVLLLGMLLRVIWRWTRESWTADGRSAQIAAALLGGALIWSAVGALQMFRERGYQADGRGLQLNDLSFTPSGSRATHQALAALGRIPTAPEQHIDRPVRPTQNQEPFRAASSPIRRPRFAAGQPTSPTGCAKYLIERGEVAQCQKRANARLPGDGEDIAQLTLYYVCQKAGHVEDLNPYFGRSCTNRIATWVSRLKRRVQIEPESDPVEHARPWYEDDQRNAVDHLKCIRTYAQGLKDENPQILELATLGHSRASIGEQVGLTESTVRQRLKRIRDKLRQECAVWR